MPSLFASSDAIRLLLVEDSPADVRLLQEALRDCRDLYPEVEVASNLGEALESTRDSAPDVILLDLGLPDATGLEAVVRLREAAPDVALIVLTGLDDREMAVRALRLGAQDYLAKGELTGPVLTRSIRHSIERERLERVERFMASAARVLGSSLRLEDTFKQLADLSVRNLADFCIVDLLDGEGRLERLLVAHRDAALRPLAESLEAVELDRNRPHLAFEAALRGEPLLVDKVTDEHVHMIAQNAEHARLLAELRMRSYVAVPLRSARRLLGVLVLISRSRRFTHEDAEVAGRFAELAATAIQNARLYEQSAEALRTRDRVLGVVAHDLRNPLSTIAMCAELLLEVDLDEAQRMRQLEIIRRSAYRMNRLIEDLLDVARIQQGGLVLERSYRDPGVIVQDVVEANAGLAAGRELTLLPAVEPTGPVHVDHERIVQVLTNLVGNSLKFTPAGGTIRVGAEENGDEVRFFVDDTGPGIDPADAENLFRPFWQGRGKSGDGAGLGLSISRGLVEAHGGRIWAESRPGEGTTMYFTIPLATERRDADSPGDVDA